MKKQAFLFSAGEYLPSEKLSISNLSGAKYDILAIEKRLLQIGFDVIKKEDALKAEYIPALKKGIDELPSDAVSIVYFSGHGGHFNGKNYIYPIDFGSRYDALEDIDDASVDITKVINIFKNKGRLILILDSCRCDIGLSKGYYSEMTSFENVYIAYGTMFQNQSIGVENGVSWFTEAICDEILTADIDVDTLFTRVRKNIYTKHYIQIPPSVNALLDNVYLHSLPCYGDIEKQVYDFIEKDGNQYEDKYGYFSGEYLIFIDAAQYFNIGLLDAYWYYTKVQDKLAIDKGIDMPVLPEAEQKIIKFLDLRKDRKHFYHDISYTWYYNGRQIRMGEIPPLPPSMQQKLPEQGKELNVEFSAIKQNESIIITTNLPELTEIFAWNDISKMLQKLQISDGKIVITDANDIRKVIIDSCVSSSDEKIQQIIGDKCRNLVGQYVKYHPILGNQLRCEFNF